MKNGKEPRGSIGCVRCIAAMQFALCLAIPVTAQTSNAKGKISRNFYRVPYADGAQVKMSQDYVDHGNTPAGDTGSMDMTGQSGAPYFIVAAADGQIISVSDTLNGCGCDSAYGPCANVVAIQHANGEVSTYLHIRQNSATAAGIAMNDFVFQGDVIGIEGDVGWTCGSGSTPRTSVCVPTVPAGAGNCGPHLHWNVVRASTGERVNPMTCNAPGGVYIDDITYPALPCDPPSFCFAAQNRSRETYSGFGTFSVLQSYESITASSVTVQNFASLVYHSAERVRLTPGFHAGAGSGYFRAEIGECSTTAP